MNLGQVLEVLEAKSVSGNLDPKIEIRTACGADLMSDVLAFAHSDGNLLLTGLVNPQVVITADMASVLAIVFVRGKLPPSETIAMAEERGIPLLSTICSSFEACGRLYLLGLESCDVRGADRRGVMERLKKLS